MSISTTDIEAIQAALMAQAGLGVSDLRARFPHFAWTVCDAADVDDDPLLSVGRLDLHLINASNHCVSLTSDLAKATGVMLATRRAP